MPVETRPPSVSHEYFAVRVAHMDAAFHPKNVDRPVFSPDYRGRSVQEVGDAGN
jgi:hypothetical protein